VRFEDLIVPCEQRKFFQHYWEKSPLLVQPDQPQRYASLLRGDDVDRLVSLACRSDPNSIELIGSEQIQPAHADCASALKNLLDRGASFRLRNVQQFCQPLNELCSELEQKFNSPVRANLYYTPPNAQAFKLHFDTHEVLVFQIAGSKQWRVFKPQLTLPLGYVPPLPFEKNDDKLKFRRGALKQAHDEIDEDSCGRPVVETVLNPGDLLYLPRGFIHAGRAISEPSVHLTIGIHVLTWLDLLSVALGQAANNNRLLRRALPLARGMEANTTAALTDEFNRLVKQFSSDAEFQAALDELATSFHDSRQAANELLPNETNSISPASSIEHGAGVSYQMIRRDSLVGLVSGSKVFWLPESFVPTVKFIAETPRFFVADIPGGLSDSSKCALIRGLVREGFLLVQ
jgi:ribosomal protein L16 Arg81 hydroxylase